MTRASFWLFLFGVAALTGCAQVDHVDRLAKTSGDSVVHAYDPLAALASLRSGRLQSSNAAGLGISEVQYDGADRVVERIHANSVHEVLSYDVAGRLEDILHRRMGGTIAQEHYRFDPLPTVASLRSGNRIERAHTNGAAVVTSTYGYDKSDRLVSTTEVDVVTTDTLDEAGNRTERKITQNGNQQRREVGTYNNRQQITRLEERNAADAVTATTTYSYDALPTVASLRSGNRTREFSGSNTTEYRYDRKDRLIAQGPSGLPAIQSTTWTYHPEGYRASERSPTAEKQTIYDGRRLVTERNGLGNTIARYRWGLGRIGEERGPAKRYFHADSHGSPIALTQPDGIITDRYRYDAYGQIEQQTGTSEQPFRYAGYLKQADGPASLYAYARTYKPGLGRFMQTDPVSGFDQMMPVASHRYLLGYGNPAGHFDPDGRYAEAGHYYTVLLAAKAAGYETDRALTIALFAQLPDEIGSLDATNLAIQSVLGQNGIEGLRWRGDPSKARSAYELSAMTEKTFTANEFGVWRVHDIGHSLSGGDPVERTADLRRAATEATSDETLGILLHAFGDSYSHRQLGKEEELYSAGAGHTRHLTRPDQIAVRPKLYQEYLGDLVDTLAKKRGHVLKNEERVEFITSMMNLVNEPVEKANARIRSNEKSNAHSYKNLELGIADKAILVGFRKKAQNLMASEDVKGGVEKVLTPEKAGTGYFARTAALEQEQLDEFYEKSYAGKNVSNGIYGKYLEWNEISSYFRSLYVNNESCIGVEECD